MAAPPKPGPFFANENALPGPVAVLLTADLLMGVDGGSDRGVAEAMDEEEGVCAAAAAAIAAGERYMKVFCFVAGVLLAPRLLAGVLDDAYLLDTGVPGVDGDVFDTVLMSLMLAGLRRRLVISANNMFSSTSGSAADSNVGTFTSKIRTCTITKGGKSYQLRHTGTKTTVSVDQCIGKSPCICRCTIAEQPLQHMFCPHPVDLPATNLYIRHIMLQCKLIEKSKSMHHHLQYDVQYL